MKKVITYDELKKQDALLDKEIDKLYRKMDAVETRRMKLKTKYVESNKPIPVRYNQRIKIQLQGKRKYSKEGVFRGFYICNDGTLRPDIYGVKYSNTDPIIKMELSDEQPQGCCEKCLKYKDGYCYLAGGKNRGKSYATHKVKDGDIVCPLYEEVTELWRLNSDVHYPHVTKMWDTYRVYNRDWSIYTEYKKDKIHKFFRTKENEI